MKRLLVGFKAAELTPELLAGEVLCHTLDIYHAHAIEKTHPAVRVVCASDLPQEDFDEIVFRTGPKLMSGELALDLLQQIHLLKPRSFRLDYVGRERDRNDLLDKIRKDPDRVRDFSATWQASVPGFAPLSFKSFPGCFCHRRLDEGGLALAEVVSRECRERAGFSLLDMGAGTGLVGLLVATSCRVTDLVMIDSYSRSVVAARENAAALGVAARVFLADDGIDSLADVTPGSFDVFVGNPPYYSDYRIAEVFLSTAAKALKPGGEAYTVVKTATGLKSVQARHFAAVEEIRRRGYSVLKSVK